jgi:hypothetical protein
VPKFNEKAFASIDQFLERFEAIQGTWAEAPAAFKIDVAG